MSQNSKIEWCDASWSPVTGCTPVSPGCQNCYAKRMATRLKGRCGYPADEPFRVTLHPERLKEPLRWKKPRRIFVCSMSDLFHDEVPDEFIDDILWRIFGCEHHQFLLLTKRPGRMRDRLTERPRWCSESRWPLHNLWLGVTAEDQQRADERIPLLLQTPAAVRFVSAEPLLGPVDLTKFGYLRAGRYFEHDGSEWPNQISWVIAGGETGPGARPAHPDWFRQVRDQCASAGVPFFFRGWGEWASFGGDGVILDQMDCLQKVRPRAGPDWGLRALTLADGTKIRGRIDCHTFDPDKPSYETVFSVGKKRAGRLLDGREWNEYPEVKS